MSNVAKLVLKSSKICQISSTLVCNEHKRAQLITTRLIFECSWSFHGPVTVDIYNHEQSGGTGIQSSIPTAVSGPFPVRLSHSRYPRCSGFPGAFQVTEHLSSWSTPPPTHPIIQKTKRSSAGPAEPAEPAEPAASDGGAGLGVFEAPEPNRPKCSPVSVRSGAFVAGTSQQTAVSRSNMFLELVRKKDLLSCFTVWASFFCYLLVLYCTVLITTALSLVENHKEQEKRRLGPGLVFQSQLAAVAPHCPLHFWRKWGTYKTSMPLCI